MNAIVLAGGYGSRLKPLTDSVPKPMLNICNRPIIDYCVSLLYHYGIRDIVFTLGYKPEQVVEWTIGYTGISTHFTVEDIPLGTLGGVKAAEGYLDDLFIVLSGDGISDINLNAMVSRHLSLKSEVTIAVKKVANPALYGVAELNENGLINGFIEKPHAITAPSFINCGVYIVNKRALDYINLMNCDFARDLFPVLVKEKKLAYYEHEGYWQDVGDFVSFYNANFEILKKSFFSPVRNFNEGKFSSRLMGNRNVSLVSTTANVEGRILDSIIGHNSVIDSGAVLQECVVLDNCNVTGRHFGCIISENSCIDVFDTVGLKVGQTAQRPFI